MADLEQLYAALEKADAAGDIDDAKDIASLIREQRSQQEESSTLGTLGRGAIRGALPAAAGIVGGAAGAALGAPVGLVGAIPGGLAGGFGAAAAASVAQEKFLEEHPEVASFLGQSKEQQAIDIAQHPTAAFAGELAPNLLALRPSGALLRSGKGLTEEAAKALTAEKIAAGVNATVGAGVGAGVQAGQEAMGEEPIDWTKVGIAGLVGATGQKETALGRGLTRIGEAPVSAASKAAVNALRRPGETTPSATTEIAPDTVKNAPETVPESSSQRYQEMLDELEGKQIVPEKTAELTPAEAIKEEQVQQVAPEIVAEKQQIVEPKEVIPEAKVPTIGEQVQAELKDLYKQNKALSSEKDNLNVWLRKVGINTKDRADMGIPTNSKDYPHVFRNQSQRLDVLMHDAIENGIISEADLARFPDPVEGFRQLAKDAIDGNFAATPKNMETQAKLQAIQDRIDHLESIPKEQYGLKAETAEETKARIEQEAVAKKAKEDADVQAEMDALAERDRAEIARRSQERSQDFALGQTPEESLTGQQRLDEDIPFDFSTNKLTGTPEQIKRAKESVDRVLKDVDVAWQEGDLGLVRGYDKNTGEVMYTPYKDGKVWPNDVRDFKGSDFRRFGFTDEQGAKLNAARALLEKEAATKHETAPYLKFDKEIQFSPDIPTNIQNVIIGWKGLLGLKENTYFTTLEHAAKNKNEFTGPHRKIGSASAMENENGFTSKLADGNRVVAFKKEASMAKTLETIAHELGHAHMNEVFVNAPKEVKETLNAEFLKWARSIKGDTYAKDLIESLRARKTGKMTNVPEGLQARNLHKVDDYWRTFKEWYADQTSRWATTTEKPLTVVEKFFSKLGKALKSFYSKIKNAGYLPSETFKQYMDSQVAKLDLEPIAEKTTTPISTESQATLFSKSAAESVPPKAPVTAKNIAGESISSNWEAPPVTKFSEFTRLFQNKHVDLKRTVDAIKSQIGELAERWNPYQKEGLYHSKVANRSRVFVENEIDPLVKKMNSLKVTNDELHDYLHNRHAEEYNKQMNKINPDIIDENGNVIPYTLKDRASGIRTEDAQKYLAGLESKKKNNLESVAKDLDKIIEGTQKLLVESGQEKKSTIDAWNRTYKHYVPLFREMESNKIPTLTKRGMGVSGGFSKRAMGSEREVADIANSIVGQREKAIEIAEKMEVDHALYGLSIKAPNPDVWLPVNPDAIKNPEILARELQAMGLDGKDVVGMMQERKTRVIEPDPATGLDRVVYKTNPLERYKDNVLPIRINGEDRFIFFNKDNPVAANMVRALRNMDTPTIGLFGKQVGKATQWMAKVNTQWNPVFGGLNFMRDFSSAMANLSSTELKGEQASIAKGIQPAMSAIWKTMRAERSGEPLPNTAEAKLYQEFREHGGQTLYREQLIRRADQENLINEKIKQLNSNAAKKAASGFFNGLSDFNDSIENAIRLSAFKRAREKGMSAEKAATIAKELTVNFDRKGAYGQQINNYFAFFNASAQGVARMTQTLKGPAGKKIIMGGIGLGALQAGMMEMAGFDDNDPPEFVKSRNMIIPTVDGKYIAIPYPLGLHFLPNIGRIAVETGLHGDFIKHAGNMAAVVADAFNPLGGGNLSLQTISPTVLDPAVALATNKDAFGRPIAKLDRETAPTTGLSRSREQSTEINKAVAKAINYITGGTEDTKGFLSPTADQLDYLVGQVTGGAGREVMKVGQTAKAIASGDTENLPSYQIPLAGRFYGDVNSPAANSQHFYDNVTRMAEHEATIKGMRQRKENVAEYLRDNPDARLWQQANNMENQISALNKQRKDWTERGFPEERIKTLDDRKQAIMTRFNEKVKALKE